MTEKKIFIFIILFMMAFIKAQTFILDTEQTESIIELGTFVALSGTIQNISDDSLELAVIRTEISLPQDWNTQLCFGGICFPPDYDSLATTSSDAPFYQEPIPPDSSIYFAVWFTAFSEYEGTATATIKLYDLNNPGYVLFQDYMASTDNFILISILNDWNLVGLPLSVEDAGYSTVFPNAIPGTLYGFSDSYFQAQELDEGTGYWLRFENSDNAAVFGENISDLTIGLNEDWNLISGISDTIDLSQFDDPEDIIIPGTLFGFTGSYQQASSLLPGKGYWIRASADGMVYISTNSARLNIRGFIDLTKNANVIKINGQNLYFGISIPPSDELSYTFPPQPPLGAFDARFYGNKSVVNNRGIIDIMNPSESLAVLYDITKIDEKWILKIPESEIKYFLTGKGYITLEGNIERLILEKVQNKLTPESFLEIKVFPNPFNPVTNINISLSNSEIAEQFVSINIYDLTGKIVKEIFNGIMMKDEYKVQWDGTNNFNTHISAGVYLLTINTNKFKHTEKLLLLK